MQRSIAVSLHCRPRLFHSFPRGEKTSLLLDEYKLGRRTSASQEAHATNKLLLEGRVFDQKSTRNFSPPPDKL